MDDISHILYICFLIPMSLSLFIMESNSRSVVAHILVGTTVCLLISKVNAFLYGVIGGGMLYFSTTISPVTEEIVKALPILGYALFYSDDRHKLAQAAFALGLGFAIMENMILLTQSIAPGIADIDVTWAIIRGFGAGLMHSICTVAVGIGFSFVRQKKKLFYGGTFALLMMAITYHAIYNTLVMSRYMYLGIILPICTYLPLLYFYLKRRREE